MIRLGFVYLRDENGLAWPFAVDTSDAPSSRRAPEPPMPVERVGTPQPRTRRGVGSA